MYTRACIFRISSINEITTISYNLISFNVENAIETLTKTEQYKIQNRNRWEVFT